MRVVSNTSPVSSLAIIGRLDLLKQRYGRVSIPSAVARELSALSHPDGKARVMAALKQGWLVVEKRLIRQVYPWHDQFRGVAAKHAGSMDCGGKRSATPLWLSAERAPEPEATLHRPAPPEAKAPSPLALCPHPYP